MDNSKITLSLYLDESGNSGARYFIVGGFYLINTNNDNLNKDFQLLSRDIKRSELEIKKYRKEYEPNLFQFSLDKNENDSDKEVKWNLLSTPNKLFLSDNVKNRNQKNISIINNLKKWKNKYGKKNNLDFIYNYMVYLMIKKIYKQENLSAYKEVLIKVNIDQRKDIPKDGSNKNKALGLNDYLSTSFLYHDKFLNLTINAMQYNSSSNEAIRYADYYCGVVAGMLNFLECKFKHKPQLPFNSNMDIIYKNFSNKIKTICYVPFSDNENKIIKEFKQLHNEK